MLIPAFTIEEKRYCKSEPIEIPILESLKSTFKNPHFKYYVIADFSYFVALTIIMTGLLFYTTVLLFPENKTRGENLIGILLPIMILTSFILYPVVNILAKKIGKKVLVVVSYAIMSIVFLNVYFLGEKFYNSILSPEVQAFGIVLLYSIPLAFVSILPNAILADIAEYDALETKTSKEAMYFAARTFLQKFGQTFGIFIFAILLLLGKDPGNDIGIRLTGIAGFVLSILAMIFFSKYDEKSVLERLGKTLNSIFERQFFTNLFDNLAGSPSLFVLYNIISLIQFFPNGDIILRKRKFYSCYCSCSFFEYSKIFWFKTRFLN